MVTHTLNPSTQEAESGGSLRLRSVWSAGEFQESKRHTEKYYLKITPQKVTIFFCLVLGSIF